MHYRFRGACLPIEVLERTQPVDPDARRPDAAGPADAARGAHEARAGRRPRDGARQAGGVRAAALDLLPRGRLGGRASWTSTTPRGRPQPGDASSARRTRSATRSTGSTRTPSTSRTSTRAPTRCARSASNHDFPVRARVRVARLEPGRLAGAVRAASSPSAGDRPALPGQLEQQAGARLPGVGHGHVLVHVPLACCSRTALKTGDPRRAQAHAAEGDRHHGDGRDAATCARTRCCRSR